MTSNESDRSGMLAKIGLQETMIEKDGEPSVFDRRIFEIYAPKEYLEDAQLREADEVYRMSERVLIHKSSGMRVHYLTSENYEGDELRYKLKNIFIKTLQSQTLKVQEMDFSNQFFIASNLKIPFSAVKKDKIGD